MRRGRARPGSAALAGLVAAFAERPYDRPTRCEVFRSTRTYTGTGTERGDAPA